MSHIFYRKKIIKISKFFFFIYGFRSDPKQNPDQLFHETDPDLDPDQNETDLQHCKKK